MKPSDDSMATKEEKEEESERDINDAKVVKFLDSVDSYLTLLDSLSSTLRQGWLELASSRHSMGATRISSALFDLNCHSATTSLKVNLDDPATEMNQLKFTLSKWGGSYNEESSPEDEKFDEDELLVNKTMKSQLRHRGTSEIQEKDHESNGSTDTVEDQIKKERFKSLSMFGTLVCPKLRASQLSFESALDTLVEIANMRSALISTYNEVLKDVRAPEKGIAVTSFVEGVDTKRSDYCSG